LKLTSDIRRRALVALALNRTPGFHFPGNFLGVMFDEKTPQRVRVSLNPGVFCEDPNGHVNSGAIALLADIALASVVRANLNPAQRLATVSLQLQFTGHPCVGRLLASSDFGGFLLGTAGHQGQSRVTVTANDRAVLSGHGSFMVLNPPLGVTMHAPQSADHAIAVPPPEFDLSRSERSILTRIDEILAQPAPQRSFIQRLWGLDPQPTVNGARAVVENGPQIGNRVGHVQGGLQVGFAMDTASAALPADWMATGVSACFISPGEGKRLRVVSSIVHRGRQTAVVRTVISGKHRRRVLEATSTHARRG
jgi:acyl-coenzyme A thioesterase PaaI-like protein